MKCLIFIIIFLANKSLSFSLTTIRNLEKSSVNLLSSEESSNIQIYKDEKVNIKVDLYKKITKTEAGIEEHNYIKVNQDNYVETKWEDIESIYYYDNIGYFVCPKGN